MPLRDIVVDTAGDVCIRRRPGLLTVIDNIAVVLPPTLSVTLKVMEVGPPAVVGVPLITPVEAARDKPSGREPKVMLQV